MRSLALFVLALLAAAHAQAQPNFLSHFRIQAIYPPGPTGQMGIVPEAINNRGQITGTLYGDDWYPFFYSAGQVTRILTAEGQSVGLAINNHGQVVGGYIVAWPLPGSFIWPGSTAGFGPPNSSAYDINDSGTVVGGPPAYVYQGGVLTDLGLGPGSVATGINNSGQVVGDSGPGPFLWQNGQVESLPLSLAYAINNKGHVLGGIQDAPGGPLRLVLYANGKLRNIAIPSNATTDFSAHTLNDKDQVVGFLVDFSDGTETPFLWNGTFYDLNSLIPANSGWVLQEANGINNRGQIVGSGTLNGLWLGFVLTPE